MRSFTILSLIFAAVTFSGCTKCVECEIKLKQSQDVIGCVDEFCGTDKKVEEEEDRLLSDFYCIECSVQTGMGSANSGVLCGERPYIDSVQASWSTGANNIGTSANCIYYRDTVNVACVLKN